MIWLAALLLLLAVTVCVFVFERREAAPPLDPEAAMRASIELHRIRRRLDVDWARTELRRDADLLEHRIIEVVDSDDEP
jgi:hypothetical protein